MIVLDIPTAYAKDADEYLRKGLEIHDRFKAEPLITTAFAPHAPYSVGDTTLAHVRRLADELDRPVHIHVHETAAEVAEAVASTGKRPLARLAPDASLQLLKRPRASYSTAIAAPLASMTSTGRCSAS